MRTTERDNSDEDDELASNESDADTERQQIAAGNAAPPITNIDECKVRVASLCHMLMQEPEQQVRWTNKGICMHRKLYI